MDNQSVEENNIVEQDKVSNERKMTLINFMFLRKSGSTFLSNKETIKAFPMITEEEKTFIDEVYKILQGLNIEQEIAKLSNIEQLKEEIYSRCQIPREVVEQAKQIARDRGEAARKDIEEKRQKWAEQDAEIERKYARRDTLVQEAANVQTEQQRHNIQMIEGRDYEGSEKVGYKPDLYQPGFLCGKAIGMPDKPFVELVRYKRERIESDSVENVYQFADMTYTIKKTGELLYMSAPNLRDSISEYEITIAKDNISRTVRRFGEISFHKMSDASYSTVVFLGLLGQTNLTDRELHGYLGSLEYSKVRNEEGELEDSYKVVHLPEEYTAVAIWEEIEKAREERIRAQGGDEPLSKEVEKAAGGDER